MEFYALEIMISYSFLFSLGYGPLHAVVLTRHVFLHLVSYVGSYGLLSSTLPLVLLPLFFYLVFRDAARMHLLCRLLGLNSL